MIEERQFDAMVSGFYSAATGASSWNQALAPVHTAFGTRGAVMQSVDLTTGRIVNHSHGGPAEDEAALDYLRGWHEIDYRREKVLAQPELTVDRWFHCHEHFDDSFVQRAPFHRHFMLAYGTRYLATSATLVTPTLVTSFTLELPASRGPLNGEERHVAERLGRHVGEALRAHERMRRMASQALAGHGLLEAFTYPMWLLDAERFVLHKNAAARALAERDERITADNSRLSLLTARADRQLGFHLNTLSRGRHGMRAIVDTRRHVNDPPCWLHLQALSPQRVLGAFGDQPLVLATLFDASQMGELDPFALGDLLGMTPTEGRVAVLLADGLTAQAIGERLGCSIHTVRTHLRRVLAKLGAKRLADAVRLLRQGEALWAMPAGMADR